MKSLRKPSRLAGIILCLLLTAALLSMYFGGQRPLYSSVPPEVPLADGNWGSPPADGSMPALPGFPPEISSPEIFVDTLTPPLANPSVGSTAQPPPSTAASPSGESSPTAPASPTASAETLPSAPDYSPVPGSPSALPMVTDDGRLDFTLSELAPALREIAERPASAALISKGFDTSVEMECADYHLRSGENSAAYVLRAELLMLAAKNYFPDQRLVGDIFFVTGSGSMSGTRDGYCIDPRVSGGFIFSAESGERLPYWLCAGLERYWLALYGAEPRQELSRAEIGAWLSDCLALELPDFGDLFFVPGFFEPEERETAAFAGRIAAEFVFFLAEKGRLDGFIADWMSYKTPGALDAMWREFTGGAARIDTSCALDWGELGWLFSIGTDEAGYTFYRESWLWDDVSAYIPYMDAGIAYAESWLGIPFDSPVKVEILPPNPRTKSGVAYFYAPDEIHFSNREIFFAHGPYAIAHEMTHLLARHGGLDGAKTVEPLREGLAMLVELEYGAQSRGYFYKTWTHSSPYETHFDTVAKMDFSGAAVGQPLYNVQNHLGLVFDDLSTYYQAASFAKYLYDTYGKQKLLDFHADYYACAALYGRDIYALIDEWKAYLGV